MFITITRKLFAANTNAFKALLSSTLREESNVAILGQNESGYYSRPHWLTHAAYVESVLQHIRQTLSNNRRVFVLCSKDSHKPLYTKPFRYLVDAPRTENLDIVSLHQSAIAQQTRLAQLLPPFCVVAVLTPNEWWIHSTTPLLTATSGGEMYATVMDATMKCVFSPTPGIPTTTPVIISREWSK